MSLITQPAARITTAPTANLDRRIGSGSIPGGVPSAVPQMHGHSNSIVPICLSARDKCKYGLMDVGMIALSIHDFAICGLESDVLGMGSTFCSGPVDSEPTRCCMIPCRRNKAPLRIRRQEEVSMVTSLAVKSVYYCQI
jgi:hypothetical protein